MENVLEILEQKVGLLLKQLQELKKDNQELKSRCQQLERMVQERDLIIQQLRQDSEGSLGMKNEIETYREKHDRIRIKVESLLQKLKEFEDIQ
ncbi:MAG TPA: hypothetical protein ENN03_05515 [bacterium]|nr:hypothetical protein [bacterium]